MEKCPSCGAELQAGRPYCPTCAKVPKESSGPSYQATWAFGVIGLLVILFYWMVLTANNQQANPALPPKPVPDAVAQLIANCGKPDRDVITAARPPKVPERRWLFYRSKNITAAFDRAPQHQGAAVWNDVRYFDHVSKRQLNTRQVEKRLPCALTPTAK